MSNNEPQRSLATRHRFSLVFSAVLGLFVCVIFFVRLTRGHDVQLPNGSLSPSTSRSRPVSSASCAECHEEQVRRFSTAPHNNSLLRGDSPLAISRLNERSFSEASSGDTFRYLLKNNQLWLESSRHKKTLRVDWLFGSGHHASTPVTIVPTPDGQPTILQHVMSWYPDDTIGWTLGLNGDDRDQRGIHGVATPDIAQKTHECFICHCTWLPEEGGVPNLQRLIPNVTCTRCHSGARRHSENPEQNPMQSWSDLSPLESVNRCGECHRRADHMTADELVPENKLLVRFASASLVQSKCFQNQTAQNRMDCLRCHDPHETASADPLWYSSRCIECHEQALAECTSPKTNRNCINCHMPKEKMQDGLNFTDHWIRAHK